MITRALIGALAGVLASSAASAQELRPEGSAPLELTREAKPVRPVVRSETEHSQAIRAAAAAAAYEQEQRDQALMRELTRPTLRRPDLGYDVTGGIQQRNLRR